MFHTKDQAPLISQFFFRKSEVNFKIAISGIQLHQLGIVTEISKILHQSLKSNALHLAYSFFLLDWSDYKICLHTKSKQQHEVTFHTNLFCLH
jgi:hypothetical protein